MDIKQIKTLLAKFYDGDTSRQEEQSLFDHFTGTEDTGKEPEHTYFDLIQAARKEIPVSGNWEQQFYEKLEQQMPDEQKPVPTRRLYYWLAAASVAVLIGLSILFILENQGKRTRDTFSDPSLAYAEAQKTLLYISQTMNEGIKPLQAVSKINAGNSSLKNLGKLDHSLDMLNMVSLINNSSNLKK
jgi:hypothetical protein